jgi:hypothetical protein
MGISRHDVWKIERCPRRRHTFLEVVQYLNAVGADEGTVLQLVAAAR